MSLSLFTALSAAAALAGFAAVVWIARLAGRIPPRWRRLAACGLVAAYGITLACRPAAWPLIDLAVLAGAVGCTVLLAGALGPPVSVAVFLTVAGVVDFVSMSAGVSHVLVERYVAGKSDLLAYLCLVAPIRGHIVPIVGASDLFVSGSAAASLLRSKLRPAPVMGTFAAGLLGAVAWGFWRRAAVPVVPFLAVAVWLLVWRHSSRGRAQVK